MEPLNVEPILIEMNRIFMAAPEWAQWLIGLVVLFFAMMLLIAVILGSESEPEIPPHIRAARFRQAACEHEYIVEVQEKDPGEYTAYRFCHKCNNWDFLGKTEFVLYEDIERDDYEPGTYSKVRIVRETAVTGLEPELSGARRS